MVACLSQSTGKLQWAATLPKGGRMSSPVVVDGVVVVASQLGQVFAPNTPSLHGFNAATGAVLFEHHNAFEGCLAEVRLDANSTLTRRYAQTRKACTKA